MEGLSMESLYRRVGTEEQVYGVRRLILDEGNARGAALYQVSTAGGLDFDVLPDSGLDIGRLRWRGVNVNYMTKNGYDAPSRFLPVPDNFDHTFPGGMMYTCGLLSVGPQCRDEEGDGEFHPLHGRYHGQSARGLSASAEGGVIRVSGTVRETEQWRHNLSVKRVITAPAWGSELMVEDEVTNLTPQPVEYALLYHCNLGWPLLDADATLELPEDRKVTPRSPWAEAGLADQCRCTAPIDGEEERVYFNEVRPAGEDPRARLINRRLGIGAELSWSLDTLPILSQWKCMRSGEYVLALEPSTCYTMGRLEERRHGSMRTLAPFASVRTRVRLRFFDPED